MKPTEPLMGEKADVVIVGGGVMGCSAAYWLSHAGCQVLLLEKEAVGAGASGMAPAFWLQSSQAALETLVDDKLADLYWRSCQLHRRMAETLRQEAGVDTGYLQLPALIPAFTTEEADLLQSQVAAIVGDPSIKWLEGKALWEAEPRLSREASGAIEGRRAQVMAYRFVLALVEAAERKGARIRTSKVVGLEGHDGRVSGVRTSRGAVIRAGSVVLAMGPWSAEAGAWTGLRTPVHPVRGQILRLELPDPQLRTAIAYDHMYLLRKVDGMTVAGATYEPGSGFDDRNTPAGREFVMDAALHMAPSLEEARVVEHITGLRPGSGDGLPLIGPVPGWHGLYLVTGHDRNGMALSLASTRAVAELITRGQTDVPLDLFDPGRFGPLG
jgi:glycine oxidase